MVADRDGHEPLQALQALLRAHADLVHDRAAHAGLPDRGRRLPPPAQRHGLRRPRRRRAGSTFIDRSTWTAPFNARILGAASHHHGGAINHTLTSQTCGRTLFDAKAYYGAADHPYNTIRPILHEPGPIANGTFRSAQGLPVAAGEVLERAALHDNATLHVAAMGFWVLLLVARRRASPRCAPLPTDVREVTVPAKLRHAAPFVYSRVVPQLFKPGGPLAGVQRRASATSSSAPAASTAKVGQRLTWRFAGVEPHSVTVANGPRGFSSNYLGNTSGELLVHADGAGHVPADVPDPPDDDGADAPRYPLSALSATLRRMPLLAATLAARSARERRDGRRCAAR